MSAGTIIKLSNDQMYPRNFMAPTMDAAVTRGATGGIIKQGDAQIVNNAAQTMGGAMWAPGEWGGVSRPTPTSSAEAGTKGSGMTGVDLVSGAHCCEVKKSGTSNVR